MIRTAALGAALLRTAEDRAHTRARHGVERMAAAGLAAAAGFGGLAFASVGAMRLMAPAWGEGVAALVVAAGWLVAAIAALIATILLHRRSEPTLLPSDAPDRALEALRADLGEHSPVLAVAALVAGIAASARR